MSEWPVGQAVIQKSYGLFCREIDCVGSREKLLSCALMHHQLLTRRRRAVAFKTCHNNHCPKFYSLHFFKRDAVFTVSPLPCNQNGWLIRNSQQSLAVLVRLIQSEACLPAAIFMQLRQCSLHTYRGCISAQYVIGL